MERAIAMLLVLVILLGGCANAPQEESPTTTLSEQETDPTQPLIDLYDGAPKFPSYDPDSALREATGGAVRAYALEGSGYYAVAMMGDGIVLFSGEQGTKLTLWREEQDPVGVTLETAIYPTATSCVVGEDRLMYYDETTREVVTLDEALAEVQRIAMPEDMIGSPVLAQDQSCVYYFDEAYLRCMDLESGICRMLTNARGDRRSITGIYFDEPILTCAVYEGEDVSYAMIDATTGETVYMEDSIPYLKTHGQWYFAQRFDGVSEQYLFGERGQEPACLVPERGYPEFLPGSRRVVFFESSDDGVLLELYDTTDGTRRSAVSLEGVCYGSMVEDLDRELLWILVDETGDGSQVLLCWDPEQSLTGETTSFVEPLYTAEAPDTQGLAQVAQDAKALGDAHGVRLLVYKDATGHMPVDYTFQEEYRVSVYDHYLPLLEEALEAYPAGFLKKLGSSSGNGRLTISLVMGAYGDNDLGALSAVDGVQFWSDGNIYLTLVMNEYFVGTFFHELYHAIDTFILTETQAFDFWDGLNPEGFRYDNDYLDNQYRDDGGYLEDETRAFIDTYSMSYAKEDRARIIEYGMQPGNEAYFTSDTMQAKLAAICKGIREAFSLEKVDESLLWEQYLLEP
ncbi:MAG: hypothetical protein IJW45_07400 [Oscillospiraceae bacterium]|nr:hypothetical protein [Oscillospiraceae bacterium]